MKYNEYKNFYYLMSQIGKILSGRAVTSKITSEIVLNCADILTKKVSNKMYSVRYNDTYILIVPSINDDIETIIETLNNGEDKVILIIIPSESAMEKMNNVEIIKMLKEILSILYGEFSFNEKETIGSYSKELLYYTFLFQLLSTTFDLSMGTLLKDFENLLPMYISIDIITELSCGPISEYSYINYSYLTNLNTDFTTYLVKQFVGDDE